MELMKVTESQKPHLKVDSMAGIKAGSSIRFSRATSCNGILDTQVVDELAVGVAE